MSEAPRRETPGHILDAAVSVIVRDGIRGTSLRSVAKQADVSLGLLGYHFDDKQTLLHHAFKRATDVLLERSMAARDTVADEADPTARVEAYVRGAFHEDFLHADYLHLRISLWAASRTDSDLAAIERDLYLRYAQHMSATIAEAHPQASSSQVEHRTTDVIVVQNGLWLNWARYQDRPDLERGLRLCVALALDSN